MKTIRRRRKKMSNGARGKVLSEFGTLLIISIMGYMLMHQGDKIKSLQNKETRDTTTVTVFDTIRYIAPRAAAKTKNGETTSVVVGQGHVPTVVCQDSLFERRRQKDTTLTIYRIPREQLTYRDSSYTAWVSGVEPRLDSLKILQKNKTTTVTVVQRVPVSKHWGLGIHAGYGICGSKLQPYIGVGIQYNIFSW